MYYSAEASGDGFRGIVYRYGPIGDRVISVWKSSIAYSTREEAINAAADWLEDNDFEAHLD